MTGIGLAARVEAVRGFNRFYTQKIGVLRKGLLASPFPLTEARILYELGRRRNLTASDLCRELGLDAGYVSRILRAFEKKRLIARRRSAEDGRRSFLGLTAAGRAAFALLDRRSRAEIGMILDRLPEGDQVRLVAAMRSIERLLGAQTADKPAWRLRPHRAGDMGWVVQRHGEIYAEEYGWDESFEALVAEIVAKFIQTYDPARERCWIAEWHGAPAGSVFLVRQSERTAKLRLLIVEPAARGLGIGAALVEECLRFANAAGYRKVTLWTQSILTAARRIYQQAGFRLVRTEPHRSFGHDLVGEYWEKKL
jgi:DNA-binding MarR family transcriptional regulator/N-acetylglutamate synthase-like GNAT family acetyltransferase